MVVGALITNPIVSMVQCSARPSMNRRLRITGDPTRYDHRDGNDDYTQGQSISINEPGTA
jgi:hypothetical protein